MSAAESSLSHLLDVAIDAAYLGGRRTLAYFNAGVAVDLKSDNTPVTAADRESEQIIREELAKVRIPQADIRPIAPSLEDVFVALTNNRNGEN